MTVSQQVSPSSVRNYKYSKYPSDKTKKLLREARKAKQATSRFMAKKNAKEAAKRVKDIRRISNALKKGNLKEVNSKWGTALTLFVDAVQVGFTTFMVFKNAEIQAYNIKTQEAQEAGIQNAFTRSINNSIQIKTLQKTTQELKQSDQKNRDRIYGIEKQQVTIREKANDALYEVRKGREILEGRITDVKRLVSETNSALKSATANFKAEVSRVLNSANQAINNAKNASQAANKAQADANKLISEVSSTNSKITKIASEISTINTNVVTKIAQQITPIKVIAEQALAATKSIPTIQSNIIKIVGTKLDESRLTLARSTDEKLNRELARVERIFADDVAQARGDIELQRRRFDKTVSDFDEAWRRQSTTNKTFNEALKDIEAENEQLEKQIKDIKANPIPLPELDKLQKENVQIKKDLTKIDTQLKEQQKVNEAALPKLDSILGLIPLIPARAAGLINPNIPTIPQIENATGTAICKSANGGCLSRGLGNTADKINNNANKNKDDLLNKLNAGLQIPELALLKTIDNKLGAQLPGGLSATFGRLWRTLQVDRIMNVLILITTMHNALMLSNNIAQTLFSVFDNIGQAAGFKWQNEKGEDVGFGGLVSIWTGNFFKTIFGEENYTELVMAYKKANRIYQAGANMLNSITNMSDVILNGIEFLAGQSAKIGNALRNFRVVGEKAYEVFNPQPNLKWGIFSKLQKGQESADFLLQVSQIPVDLTQAATDFTQSATDLAKAIKEDPEVPPGLKIEDAAATKAKETQVKSASISLALSEIDLDSDD